MESLRSLHDRTSVPVCVEPHPRIDLRRACLLQYAPPRTTSPPRRPSSRSRPFCTMPSPPRSHTTNPHGERILVGRARGTDPPLWTKLRPRQRRTRWLVGPGSRTSERPNGAARAPPSACPAARNATTAGPHRGRTGPLSHRRPGLRRRRDSVVLPSHMPLMARSSIGSRPRRPSRVPLRRSRSGDGQSFRGQRVTHGCRKDTLYQTLDGPPWRLSECLRGATSDRVQTRCGLS